MTEEHLCNAESTDSSNTPISEKSSNVREEPSYSKAKPFYSVKLSTQLPPGFESKTSCFKNLTQQGRVNLVVSVYLSYPDASIITGVPRKKQLSKKTFKPVSSSKESMQLSVSENYLTTDLSTTCKITKK